MEIIKNLNKFREMPFYVAYGGDNRWLAKIYYHNKNSGYVINFERLLTVTQELEINNFCDKLNKELGVK